MNTGVKLTIGVLVFLVFALPSYDIWVGVEWGDQATISRVVLHGAMAAPFIAFAAGYLCGHLFSPQIMQRRKAGKGT